MEFLSHNELMGTHLGSKIHLKEKNIQSLGSYLEIISWKLVFNLIIFFFLQGHYPGVSLSTWGVQQGYELIPALKSCFHCHINTLFLVNECADCRGPFY